MSRARATACGACVMLRRAVILTLNNATEGKLATSMEKLPISLVLSCGDVVIRIKLPHGDKKLGAVAKAFAKSYEAKHKVALPLESIRFRRRSRFITASLQARVGDVFEDGDNVTVSVGDDKPSPAPRAAPVSVGDDAAPTTTAAPSPARRAAPKPPKAPPPPPPPREAYNDALRMKDQANERFRVKDVSGALGLYSKALETLGPPATDDEKQLGATLLNNRAACHLKQDRFADAQGDCDASLALRPSSKAFLRRATARLKKDPANLRGYRVDVVAALDAAGADAPAVRRDVVAAAAVAEGFAARVHDDALAALDDATKVLEDARARSLAEARERFFALAAGNLAPESAVDDGAAARLAGAAKRLDEAAFDVAVPGDATLCRATRLLLRCRCLAALGELHFRAKRFGAAGAVFRALHAGCEALAAPAVILDRRLAPPEASPADAARPLARMARLGTGAALMARSAADDVKAAVDVAAWLRKAVEAAAPAAPPAVRVDPVAAPDVAVVLCHGWGTAAADLDDARALLVEELRNLGLAALVVAPDAPLDAAAFVPGQKGRTWFDPLLRVRRDRAADPFAHGTPCDGVAHLAAVLRTFDVPPSRVFLGGFSMGGAAAALAALGAAAPGAPYGGVFLLGSALDDDALALALAFGALEAPPFLFAHGADDRRCPPDAVAASAARVEARLGAAVTRTEHAGLAHHISPAMLAGVAAFVKKCI